MNISPPNSKKKSRKTLKQVRETARQNVAKKRALDKSNGLRLVQVSIPEDGVTALKKFASWLRGGSYDELEAALDVTVRSKA
jgi:hypothetical protein